MATPKVTNPTGNGFKSNFSMGSWIPLSSTCFSAARVIGSPTASALSVEVQFRQSGSRYLYLGVPHELVADLMTANSHGKFYNAAIKGQFRSIHTS